MSFRMRLAAVLAGAALGLTACGQPTPTVTPPPAPAQPPPVVGPAQSRRILDDLGAQLAQSAAASSLEPLTRIDALARDMRQAQLTMAAADPEAAPDELATEFAGTIVAACETWPRQLIAVTEPTATGAQYIYLLVQSEPHSQYTMTAWARLLAGVTLPTTAPPATGSASLAVGEEGSLTISPEAAMALYAEVKENPDSPSAARLRGTDPARTAWSDLIGGWGAALAEIDGTVQHSSTPVAQSTVAIATADGGAIVIGEVSSQLVLGIEQTEAGQSFTLPDRLVALSGGVAKVEQGATLDFAQVVALAIAPSTASDEAGGDITVLGVAQTPVRVTAS